MNFKHTSTLPKNSAPVFVIPESGSIVRHPFFKKLNKEDQDRLRGFEKHTHIKGFTHTVILSSGYRAIIIGLTGKLTHHKALLSVRRAVEAGRRERATNLAFNLSDFLASDFKHLPELLAELLATQAEMANFEFVKYKTPPKEGWFFVRKITIVSNRNSVKINVALHRGRIVGEEINNARSLSNTPGGDMTPNKLAAAARTAGRRAGFKTKILGETQMKKLRMGGILGVAKGSSEKPHFIIMEYRGASMKSAPTILIGKGVTFDTGGLNLKLGDNLNEMHMDMSAGASVIHILSAVARLKLKINLVGLVPAVENMPSGSSYRPGDLLKTMSGKTVEVLNTDAEGRIILADALTYAQKFYKPKLVIDLATLTGASVSALGQRASAVFSADESLIFELRSAGELTGDRVWPLPLWEEYEDEIKGTFGDLANVGKTRYGGAIQGAVFLWQFIKDKPWAHIDIAPRMTSFEGEYLAKGAVGAGVGLLLRFLSDFK